MPEASVQLKGSPWKETVAEHTASLLGVDARLVEKTTVVTCT